MLFILIPGDSGDCGFRLVVLIFKILQFNYYRVMHALVGYYCGSVTIIKTRNLGMLLIAWINATQTLEKKCKHVWIKEKKIFSKKTLVEETNKSNDNDYSLENKLSTDENYPLRNHKSVDRKDRACE